MSIINDALKKVQKNIEKAGPPSPIPPPHPPTLGRDHDNQVMPTPRITKSLFNTDTLPQTKPAPRTQERYPTTNSTPSIIKEALTIPSQRRYQKILIGLCGSICLILIFLIVYLFYLFGSTHSNPNPFQVKKPRHSAPNKIVIQGIMAKDDKNVALINDEIYEIGQTVMGRKIVNITEDNVQVSYRGKIKNLRVK